MLKGKLTSLLEQYAEKMCMGMMLFAKIAGTVQSIRMVFRQRKLEGARQLCICRLRLCCLFCCRFLPLQWCRRVGEFHVVSVDALVVSCELAAGSWIHQCPKRIQYVVCCEGRAVLPGNVLSAVECPSEAVCAVAPRCQQGWSFKSHLSRLMLARFLRVRQRLVRRQ